MEFDLQAKLETTAYQVIHVLAWMLTMQSNKAIKYLQTRTDRHNF